MKNKYTRFCALPKSRFLFHSMATPTIADTKLTFSLGEQPEWAGKTEITPKGVEFIEEVIKNPSKSLVERGYAIIRLCESLTNNYSLFHSAWEEFSASKEENKVQYAIQQFEPKNNSPNQYHGFSVVGGLKEQFMLRAAGINSDLKTPGTMKKSNIHFAKTAQKLYELCDQTCRYHIGNVLNENKISKKNLDKILDPIFEIDSEIQFNETKEQVYSNYLPEGYISSSIMDNFHYFNQFQNNSDLEKAFYNNHSSHTDSGLMTLVVCTDEPGLEILDQKTKEWIAIEEILHKFAIKQKESHRSYATIFWGDSCAYLLPNKKNSIFIPCFHRVAQCKKERYSVVFKQRTCVHTTPPRYQEDYLLAVKQMEALDKRKKKYSNLNNLYTSILSVILVVLCLLWFIWKISEMFLI